MENPVTAIIVDDEQDACDGLEKLIRHYIPEVRVIAKSGKAREALDVIIEQKPEIIFLDIRMPDHEGFWLSEKLKYLDISACIIFVTAYDQYAIQAIRHAAFDLLTKPVDPDKLKVSASGARRLMSV